MPRGQYEARNFQLLIYESEYQKIQAWTDKYQDLETGGDLFGLWAGDNTAVVQLVVGPGKNCKRTAASFYQDLDYLERIGNLLTNEEGLCHIGEWHSHHRLSLPRPSGGDEDTVWSNMNRYGLSRFCLLIANIQSRWYRSETTVNGFLFEVDSYKKRRLPLLQGKFLFLQEEKSPLRSKKKVIDALREGAEDSDDSLSCQAMESALKKHVQIIKELEDSREQMERKLEGSEQRSRDLEKSLTAARQAKEEIERQLRRSEQQLHQLEKSFATERQAKEEETKRRLQRFEKKSHELGISLATERQAKEEIERKLQISELKSRQLEKTLAEERQAQARKDEEKQLQRIKIRSSEPGASLAKERNARQLAEDRLRNVEHRSNELETSLVAERNTRLETQRQLQNSKQRSLELETSLAAERYAKEETERQLQRRKQKLEELETTLATANYNLEEYRSSSESCNWILDRNEIALSDKAIGEGGLGKVIEGTFGGCKVAVKKIHQPILSPDDRDLFQREMSIAFRCRHPCLLEIIGATNDDESPLIVTELMDTNLRALLDERELEAMEIKTVALDVAKGLNYLHLRSPRPIVHGRISSANVLLWRHGSDGWRTKLSDYGTVNFLQQSKNVCPGAEVYSAPEARAQPSAQSPKADMYSFGVLLFEMITGELPNIEQRNRQIVKVKQQYRRIIIRCWKEKPEYRYDAVADIIEVLGKSQ